MLLKRPFWWANISFPVGENGVDLMECYCYEKEGGILLYILIIP